MEFCNFVAIKMGIVNNLNMKKFVLRFAFAFLGVAIT